MAKTLQLGIQGTIEGNKFTFCHLFELNDLEFDAAHQIVGDKWEWKAEQNIPLSIPIDLPFGIKEVLHEPLSLAEDVIIELFNDDEASN